MEDGSRKQSVEFSGVVGLDLGDQWAEYCELEELSGGVVGVGRVRMSREGMRCRFAGRERLRVIVEVGTHSAWVSRSLSSWGHEVIVANARQVALISRGVRKSDATDAETLARLGRVDPALLRPVEHRSEAVQMDRTVLKSREALVECRTRLINHARAMVKVFGERLPRCAAASFARRVSEQVPKSLRPALEPVLEMIAALTQRIRAYDQVVETLCRERYVETALLRQVDGVGALTSLAFMLRIEEPQRFSKSREVGPYVGLVPKSAQSGDSDPQLRITKHGDRMLRKLLIQSAHYILGPFGKDSDLRRYGQRMAARGGKNAKKRAVVAVARKLAVLLHRLWVTGEVYDPLYASAGYEDHRGVA